MANCLFIWIDEFVVMTVEIDWPRTIDVAPAVVLLILSVVIG